MAVQEVKPPGSIPLPVCKPAFLQCVHASIIKLSFTAGATRSGKSIGQLITSMIRPANVYSYLPGMNRVTTRLMKNLEISKDQQQYVEDVGQFLSNWAMEGT